MRWERAFAGVLLIVLGIAIIYRLKLTTIPGIRITSWWRTPWKNAEVGGVQNSKHLIGWGFDVVPVTPVVGQALKKLGFAKVLNEGDHYHLEII